MLNEPSGADIPVLQAATPANDLRARLRSAVDEVFLVEFETHELPEPITASYSGKLMIDSATAYDKLDSIFKTLDHVPVFLTQGDRQVIRAVRGRFKPLPRPWWPNALLLVLTILSLLIVGAGIDITQPFAPLDMLRGWPYALGVLLILGTHELGHYFAARRHKVAVTLPYFIPLPVALGTMGAFIQLREPMRNRRVLLDVGAAGPLAGMLVAIPILLIGLKTSPVQPSPYLDLFMLRTQSVRYDQEGNSLLYAAAKILVFGRYLPDGMRDVTINQLAQAGWVGLLVTALNLIPIGQLDGGHTLYSLVGERARVLYLPLLAVLGLLSIAYPSWLIWLVLLLVLGRIYATPLDMITTLDRRRRMIAIITLVVFILVFMPYPAQSVFIPPMP